MKNPAKSKIIRMPGPDLPIQDEDATSSTFFFNVGGQRAKIEINTKVTDVTGLPLAPVKQFHKPKPTRKNP